MTDSNLDFTTAMYYLNCSKTRSVIMNNSKTTPFWSDETTTFELTTGNTTHAMLDITWLTGNLEIIVMVLVISGMVTGVTTFAHNYQTRYTGNEKYHDSPKKARVHVAVTLFTYVLHLFDTLSDVFMFMHYYSIGQYMKSYLVMIFIFAPVVFMAYLVIKVVTDKYIAEERPSFKDKVGFIIISIVIGWALALPGAVLLPTLTCAHILAKGKRENKLEYITSYLTLVEAILESAPQLTLQIYLLIIDTHIDTSSTRMIQYLSIAASSLVLAWSLNDFKYQYRKMAQDIEDTFLVKFIHWISRFVEILPRIILIALMMAEYSAYVSIFVIYRILHGCVYGCRKCLGYLDVLEFCLAIICNIFCFSISKTNQCHKEEQCGRKFFAVYYFFFYVENICMLCLWYSDDPVLLQLKIRGACSNHEWYAPYVFGVVFVGSVLQLSFLFLYYWIRRTQGDDNSTCSFEINDFHNVTLQTTVVELYDD